ncbi:MAG: macro domain-containing protein [Waddliaceae bacterium]
MEKRIVLKQGDITKEEVAVIVNAANSGLQVGGGVCGAIHSAGGPAILDECEKIFDDQGSCQTGEAVITTAGNLKAKYVIHTVGPVWQGGDENEAALLHRAYVNSLTLAEKNNALTVAFPSISTGSFGYPIKEAAMIALSTIDNYLSESKIQQVRMILFSEEDFQIYKKIYDDIS